MVVYFLVNMIPDVGQFLEITCSSYGGVLSGSVSIFVWFIIYVVILGAMSNDYSEI